MRTTVLHTRLVLIACLFALSSLSTPHVSAADAADTVRTLSGTEIQTTVDRTEILIGDLIKYSLIIIHDSSVQLIPPPLGANLGAFDVKNYQPDRVTHLEDGRIRNENIFVLSTFTTGDYVIPPVPVAFKLSDGSRKVILSEAVPIKVKSLLAEAGDSVDIRPLKAQFEPEPDLTPYFLWGGLSLLVVLLLTAFFWYRHKKKLLGHDKIDLRPPWEIAFEKMAFLKQKSYIADGDFRLFYLDLTAITRWYLGRIYSLNVPDMTTEELLEEFKSIALPGDLFEQLTAFLKHADLVKFAKMSPAPDRPDIDFEFVHRLVGIIQRKYQASLAAETNTTPPVVSIPAQEDEKQEGAM